MPPTTPERYAVVSCHVERPLEDRVWAAFAALQERRPGGLAIAALLRPPDAEAGEHDDELWLERAREAASRGPLGHHTHFTSPTHARPTGGDPGERVRREGAWLAERGITPTLYCGGGWYTDRGVAAACAELGYADCTPRVARPSYLPEGAAWAELDGPARLELDGSTLCAVPTSHGAGGGASVGTPGFYARVAAATAGSEDVRRSRVYVLSRGPIQGLVLRVLSVAALVGAGGGASVGTPGFYARASAAPPRTTSAQATTGASSRVAEAMASRSVAGLRRPSTASAATISARRRGWTRSVSWKYACTRGARPGRMSTRARSPAPCEVGTAQRVEPSSSSRAGPSSSAQAAPSGR